MGVEVNREVMVPLVDSCTITPLEALPPRNKVVLSEGPNPDMFLKRFVDLYVRKACLLPNRHHFLKSSDDWMTLLCVKCHCALALP